MRYDEVSRYNSLPLSSTTSLVTPNAVSVVIWIGPRCLVGNPSARSSEVRSRGGSSPVTCKVQPLYFQFAWVFTQDSLGSSQSDRDNPTGKHVRQRENGCMGLLEKVHDPLWDPVDKLDPGIYQWPLSGPGCLEWCRRRRQWQPSLTLRQKPSEGNCYKPATNV